MNLFFVSSPFQLMNAIEAREFFNCQNSILVLRDQENELAENHVERLLVESDWDHILRLSKLAKSIAMPRMPRLLRELKKLNKGLRFDRVFSAEYSTWRSAVLLANLEFNEEVMIDDGTLTLYEYEEHIKPHKVFSVARAKKDLLLRLFGYKPARKVYPRENFKIFTYFNIEQDAIPIERNQFRCLSGRFSLGAAYNPNGSIAYVGDGGTKELIKVDSYLSNLKELCVEKSSQTIYYFPHRNEGEEVRQQLSLVKNLRYVETDLPIELQLTSISGGISGVYGTYSSALFSLAKIYPRIPIHVRKLTEDDILSNSSSFRRSLMHVERYLTGPNVCSWGG